MAPMRAVIYLTPDANQAEFETSDETTVAALRVALTERLPTGYTGQTDWHSVPAHDLAAILREIGRKYWAAVIERDEESASMVDVRFS